MAFLWFAVVALSLIFYIVLDGYDLGVGITTLFDRDLRRRRQALEIVASAWDGNESWLILLGVAIWAGFPTAYGVILPHLYLPLIVMLFALIGRGASIELVSSADRTPPGWMAIFGIGSLVAALAQGVIFGALTQAVAAGGGVFEGGAMDFLTPYTALTGIAAALVYAALGAGFLRFKGDDGVRVRAGTMGRVLMGFAIVLSLVAAVSIGGTAAPMLLDEPGRAVPFWILAAVAAVAAAVALATFGDPKRRDLEDMVPFLALCFTIVAGFLAFVVGRYPTLLPPALTVQSAVSPNPTLIFLLIGVGANIPLVLFYNWYAHHVFRGRYREAVVRRPTGVSASQQALAADGPAATKGDAR